MTDGSSSQSVQVVDFSRSFLTFRIDTLSKPPQTVSHQPPYSLNNARIQIDCRCRVRELSSGHEQTLLLGANCKTERVGVERDIWTEPNADFVPVFSETSFLNLKTFARADIEVDRYPPGTGKQSIRQTGRNAETFDDVRLHVVEHAAEQLLDAAAVVAATLAHRPLVARTEIRTDRYRCELEYPVKTMNANERDQVYQTDTGPVLLPDLDRDPDDLLAGCELAFAAFNCPEWIELLVRQPTDVGAGVSVFHYSQPVRLNCRNTVYAV